MANLGPYSTIPTLNPNNLPSSFEQFYKGFVQHENRGKRGYSLSFSPGNCKIKIAFHSQMSKVSCAHTFYCNGIYVHVSNLLQNAIRANDKTRISQVRTLSVLARNTWLLLKQFSYIITLHLNCIFPRNVMK